MKGRGKKRLMAGTLCLAMLLADVEPMSLRVVASEAGQKVSAVSDGGDGDVTMESNGEEEKGVEATSSVQKDDDGQNGSVGNEGGTEDTVSSTEGEERTENGAASAEGSSDSGDGDEKKPSEGNGGTGGEAEPVEGNGGTGSGTDMPETGDSVGGEAGSVEGSGGETEGDKIQDGESAPEETENPKDENGEETVESGEEPIEETVSENTAVTSEEVTEDADAVTMEAQSVTASGKCGDNLTWTLEDGTLTIAGTGEMYDYRDGAGIINPAPWKEYRDSINKLIIESGVTNIGDYAFYKCSGITGNLIIPNSVTIIGDHAFYECSGITGNLIIPNSVTIIGDYSFQYCSGLAGDLIVSSNAVSIGSFAFAYCSGFSGNLEIPNSVTSIGICAFVDCSGFDGNLILSSSITSIGRGAFAFCSGFTGSLTIPNSVVSIGESAFRECSGFTGGLMLPDSVTDIGPNAFCECSGFTGNLTLSNSITDIGNSAFYYCSGFTGSLMIPNSVTSIGECAFCGCSGFTGSLTIPNSVTNIMFSTFANCSGFSGKLEIPNSVTNIGERAFSGCSGFTGSLTIPNGVMSIEEDTFIMCSGFTGSLSIPDSVTCIGVSAFLGCSGLTGSLVIPNSVTSIGSNAFSGCSGFNGNLILPSDITSIEDQTFRGCSGFTGNLMIPNSVTSIGIYAFEGCNGFSGSLLIPNSVTSIGQDAFNGCSGLNGNLIIPNSVASIENDAFKNCSGFTGDLKIPDGVTCIGMCAFEGCSGFNGSLTIPNGVTNIGSSAFSGCSGFNGNLILPSGITSIGGSTFSGCSGFGGNLTIPDGVTSIGYRAFSDCSGFTGSLTIPDGVMSIDSYAFNGCSGFDGNLILSSSITSIGERVFEGCSGLIGNLTIPSSVTSIGFYAFGGLNITKKVYWNCTLPSNSHACFYGGIVIYDDNVPEPTFLSLSTRIKRSDYEASEGDFPSDIQVPPDKAAIGAVDSTTGRLIRSAYIILDGQTYRTDVEGVYYFSLGQSSAAKRLVGATADGYLRANAVSMSVQHGRLATASMTKIVSDPVVGGDDVQVPAGKFAVCVVDDSQKLIKNAVVEIDGDKIAAPDGVYYVDADSKSHYVSASAKGYGAYISVPVTFNSGEKFSVFLRWNEDYNVTYTVGKVDSQDVFTQKICLDSWEYNTSNNFDFTKAASLLGKTAVLRMRDGMVMEIYALEECVAVSVSIVPDTSSFIYQDGRFSKDVTDVHVSVHYMIKDGFPSTLLNGVQQKPKFEMNRIRLTIDEGMKVRVGKEEGNEFVSSESKILSVGETYSFDASVILKSKAKPIQPSLSYKMAVEASGPVHSAKGFQTFRVADADYKKEQTDKRPTTSGSDVSKASVAELLDANILFNIRGTVLEEQYFSEEQIQAVEKMLTLWVVNIDAATDTAREISGQEQFVMDVLNQLKVNIKPYVGVSDTTAQMRIIAETKNYGKRTFIFTLNLKNYRWDDKAPFARFGTVEWNVENPDGIPERFQHNICTMVTKASTDRFLNQLKDLAFDSIKNVYKKAWGNNADKVVDNVAGRIIDKRMLEIMNREFGKASDMCFNLMIQPTESYVKKGGRKKTTTRCPVDIYVYDGQGNIAGAIIDDIAYPMDDGVLVYVEDGAKIVDYYADEYMVKFVGNDTGTMSHEVCEYYNTGELARRIDFKDIPLNDGKIYQETIPDYFLAPSDVYALEEESQEPIYPDTDSYDEERPEIILVNGISVTPETITLKAEEEKALEAVITPAEASLKLVEWSSDNENVVAVSDTGTIKAIGAGTAKVKAISVDGRYEAECTVTVDISGSGEPEDPNIPEDPDKPGQGDVLDEDMPQGGIDNIPKGLWISEVKPQGYTGSGIKPEVRVYDYKTLLQVKKDYTISYRNNIKANNAQMAKTAPTITVTGKGNYSGKETQAFQILQKDITDDDIIADDIVLKANKKMQKSVPVVSWDGKKLANKRDFSVSYTDTVSGAYKECGTYEIVLVGMGNYTGTRRIALTITEGKLASKLSVAKIPDQIYTGNEIKPVLTVKDGKTLLTDKVHYTVAYQNNVDAGTATVLLSGIGNYVGTKRVSFKIKAVASLKNASVFLSDAGGQKYAGGIYSGEEIKPDSYTLTVTVKGVDKKNIVLTLKEGVDYQVSYKNNIEAGNATIQFSGINGYTGNIKKIYKIKPYHFETDQVKDGKIKVALNQSYSYVKGGCKPKPAITFDGRELREKTDYTLSYKNNTKLNDGSNVSKIPTVTITGKGNFRGKITDTYFIAQADISKLSLTAADRVWQNKGNIYKTKVTVRDIDNKALSAGQDYDKNLVYTYHEDTRFADGTVQTAGTVISAKDMIPAGTIIGVTINAKGPNYYGAIYGTYRITKADIGKAVVKIPAQIYTGKAIKPDDEIEIKLNRQPLSKDNYEITGYSDNVNRGTATVTIRGKNDCGGTKNVKFTIKSKGFSWWWRK